MSKSIKEEINKFKEKNGNDNFSTKELIIYAIQRLDNLPCEAHINKISTIEGRVELGTKISIALFGLLMTLISGLIYIVLTK